MDLAALARYPFLPEAAEHVAKEGPALEDLLTDKVYARARAAGRERLRLALEDAALPAPPLTRDSPPRELLEDLLSYVYARILVSAVGDAYVVRRHALAEAVRVRDYLMKEERPENLAAAARTVDLAFEAQEGDYVAHFTDFLKHSVHLKDAEWKLVSQRLSHGNVIMSAHVASRLVQEALRRRIETELPKRLSDEVALAVEPDAAPIREAARIRKEAYSVEGFGKVDLTCIPPCMRNILGSLQRGENAAHNARFAIVTFLHKIGMTSEEIMKLFSQAPDFREDLTRYQVEHITGVTSGTSYSVPGCDNLQTFNLCYMDDLCRTKTRAGVARVRYPGDYYRYMLEAKTEVDLIAARLPLANPEALAFAGAMHYPTLLRIREAAARIESVDATKALAFAAGKLELREGKIVVPEKDPAAILIFLQSAHVRA
ncbi:MAG TPA: DNA primase large subunit PriL [Candidatus Thermoplasmatota archaeon]|nr:DNA primase large subunit PriL [Candidatus Thermoplasmatota archaeon]